MLRINALFVSQLAVILTALADAPLVNCYEPIPGGWHIRLESGVTSRPNTESRIGVVPADANPRLFRRPLYPPADRTMLFTTNELAALKNISFRPLVLAYHEPRFLFDFHSAGGLLGHLYIGLAVEGGPAKWFHQWANIDLNYREGRLEYTLADRDFSGVTVHLVAQALADSAGLILKVNIQGAPVGARLVWAYGGASAFFTNWAMTAPDFAFSPNQCNKDQLKCGPDGFWLSRKFDKSDVIMSEVFAVPKYLPGWTALIRGGSSFKARYGLASPETFPVSPAAVLRDAAWQPEGNQMRRIAVAEAPLETMTEGYIVVGMGQGIEDAIRQPESSWSGAVARNHALAERMVTHTPDPYLDAAVSMMAFATEGIWGDVVMLHGGWSWRFGYLGWRHWYGPVCYGWTDRVRQSILNHVRLNRVTTGPDAGALGSLIEYSPGVFYNMNEVFFDHVRQYFEYTNDLELMREIYPVLEGILQWEDRRLRPGSESLYENALNTWISDQHWYIRGQCTQASAYMLNAHRFMAELSTELGRDGSAFAARARTIREDMQRKLWLPRAGVFAEYLDTRGHRLLHPEPELPTLYHAAEFGAADPEQIYQMLRWADTHLGVVKTPGGGKQFWSSNWHPNMARSYTHSTYEMAYAEELNFALTHYLAGRADDAYALIRASLAGIFNGPTPGGLSCHAYADGRQRANDEFADAISMWGRTIAEGLFGIAPKRPEGRVDLTPQFPPSWPEAEIKTPHFSYHWRRSTDAIQLAWSAPYETIVRLRLPLQVKQLDKVAVDGRPATYSTEAGFGLTWLILETPQARQATIDLSYAARAAESPRDIELLQDDKIPLRIGKRSITQWHDPQNVLKDAQLAQGALNATVTGEPGPATIFLLDDYNQCPQWHPVQLNIKPKTPMPLASHWAHPNKPSPDLAQWKLLDLSEVYNASVEEVLDRVHAAVKFPPAPASTINTIYYKDHLVPPFVSPKPSDARWRKQIGPDGVGWTTEGIPFRSPKEGRNIGVVTLAADVFPTTVTFKANSHGRILYLMLSGTTFAMQSHVVNLRVTLRYADGLQEERDLVNPFTIGDCWNQYRYHDTPANGFENLGGRQGPAGSRDVKDLNQPIPVDTEAHLLAFHLRADAVLDTVQIEAIANDVVFGVMGATILKSK